MSAEVSETDWVDHDAAQKLPPNILFGTSSWTYPGWRGLVYHQDYKDEKDLRARSLAEYAQFPWFRTVGVDSFFYAPPSERTLLQYASQVPEGFRWVSKVWEEITIPKYAKHARYGKKAGQDNANFLNADMFAEKVLRPCAADEIKPHVGPFVFQFQAFPDPRVEILGTFLQRLDKFLSYLPTEFQYAIEIRNEELLNQRYFDILNSHGVTHCFNHWTDMPRLLEQMKHAADAGGLGADFYVSRILTPLGVPYEAAVKRFAPYREVQVPNQNMREDVVRLAKRAFERNVQVFILVNNRSEGSAPRTINTIGRMIVDELARKQA